MGLLKRGPDRNELIAIADRTRQVLRVGLAGAVQRIADCNPQASRRQAGREPVDGHDSADMEHLVVVALGLEIGVIEGQLPPEPLQLPGDDDAVARMEPPLDVAAPEPGRLERTGLVLEDGDRPLDATPKRWLDSDVDDADPGADDGPLLHPGEFTELPHLAEVVVASRQVEEQLADGEEAEPSAGPLDDVGRGETGARDVGVEELRRVGRWRRELWRGRLRRAARRRSGHPPTLRR